MIENFDDFASLAVLAALIVYIVYRLISSAAYKRLARHIREEQRYYEQWEDAPLDELSLQDDDETSKGEEHHE